MTKQERLNKQMYNKLKGFLETLTETYTKDSIDQMQAELFYLIKDMSEFMEQVENYNKEQKVEDTIKGMYQEPKEEWHN